MGPLSYMQSVVDRNVVMRRIPVIKVFSTPNYEHTVYQLFEVLHSVHSCIQSLLFF